MSPAPFQYISYELLDEGAIARIQLDRPEHRNAQHRAMLVELGDAFAQAEADDRVRVVILGGNGVMFSSGHDMGTAESRRQREPGPDQHVSWQTNGATRDGAERLMLQEWHYFFQNTLRWRNLRKITLAAVHGPVYAAGLMLMWACDLIVAQEGTTFADVVGTRLGMCGLEYFAHPWEFGPRKAKELLLTGDSIDAEEAYRLGMVSKVFSSESFEESVLEFARRLCRPPTVAALLIKESVNQSVDSMGFHNALNACFSLHQLNHAHWAWVHDDGMPVAVAGVDSVEDWRSSPAVLASTRDGSPGDPTSPRSSSL